MTRNHPLFLVALLLAGATLLLLAMPGCEPAPDSPKGFHLPDGNVERGQQTFITLGCIGCHTVEGADLPELDHRREVLVELGGKVIKVRTYGELITAIIHPSHDIAKGYDEEVVAPGGQSRMTDFNPTMTIQQLIDLVAFLQSSYSKYLPDDYDPGFVGG